MVYVDLSRPMIIYESYCVMVWNKAVDISSRMRGRNVSICHVRDAKGLHSVDMTFWNSGREDKA